MLKPKLFEKSFACFIDFNLYVFTECVMGQIWPQRWAADTSLPQG